jgi:hypothetical protein
MLSKSNTACALDPPLMNSTLMLRPIECDGTSRYSIGSPGLENAAAVADPPAKPTSPGNTTAAAAASARRRNQARDTPPTIVIAALPPKAPTRFSGGYAKKNSHHQRFLDNQRLLTCQSLLSRFLCALRSRDGVYYCKNNEIAGKGSTTKDQAWIATSSSTSPAAR